MCVALCCQVQSLPTVRELVCSLPLKEHLSLAWSAGLDVGVNVMHLDYDVHGYYAQPPTLDDIRKVCCTDFSCYARRSKVRKRPSPAEPADGPNSE